MNRHRSLLFLPILALFLSNPTLHAQPIADGEGDVGIGTLDPDPSAILDLVASDRGILIPRMTTAERNSLGSPAEGLIIYNTDQGTLEIWSNASGNWQWDKVETTGGTFAWMIDGNGFTTPGVDYVGTSDLQGLHIYVDGGNANALILNTNGSIQHERGGFSRGANAVDLQVDRNGNDTNVASGANATLGGGRWNRATANSSTVGGGQSNQVSADYSTIAGGNANSVTARLGAIGGGSGNMVEDQWGTISGGLGNRVTSYGTSIGGGTTNEATGSNSTVGGGVNNAANGTNSIVGGGEKNRASGFSSAVGGGDSDTAQGHYSFVGGGQFNKTAAPGSVIGGGRQNLVQGNFSVVPGGRGMTLGTNADGTFGFLGGNGNGAHDMRVNTADVAVFGNTDLWLANNDGAGSELRFYEANSTTNDFPTATTYYTSFEAGDQSADINYTLPTAGPTSGAGNLGSGQMEATAGGTMSWRGTTTATSALNFPSTPAGSASDLTITVNGAAIGDIVNLGAPNGSFPSGAGANEQFSAWVSAADTITVRYHNNTGAAADPASGTFAVQVIRP